MAERETSAAITAAAALWAVRADDPAFGADAARELDAWLGGDARRLGAYARARAMLAHAARVAALGPGFDPDHYLAEHGGEGEADLATGMLEGAGAPAEPEDRPRSAAATGERAPYRLSDWDAQQEAEPAHSTRRRFLVGSSAAVAAGIAGIAGFAWQAAAATYSTRKGEIRLVPLADGSSMTLNTTSSARVKFTSSERHVELLTGEALFDVVRDAVRPFVVEAGASKVRALATRFTVSRLDGAPVTVTVRQGDVQLIGPARAAVVPANSRAMIAPDSAALTTSTLAPAEVDRALAWQQGMLSFDDTPLSEAAAAFARYSDVAIRFDDAAIGSETITGLYAANDPQGFARAAALSLGLHARAEGEAITLAR